MSSTDFIKFYSEYLPKNAALKKEIDDAADQRVFLEAVLKHGKAAGFSFTEKDVDEVMRASVRRGAELDENQLEGVVGGAGVVATKTVQISTIKSVNLAPGGNYANTIMCTTWNMPAGGMTEKL